MRRFPLGVWGYGVFLALLLSLPHIIAVTNTPQGWQYSGALPIPEGYRVDYNSHMAKMWQGSRSDIGYELLFTHEAHPALPTVQGFYVALGALVGLLRLDFALIFHLARVLLTIAMVLALWRFACHFFEDSRSRWLTLIFGTLVTGFSWMTLPFTQEIAPIEFWLLDAYNLIGAMFMPHFIAAITLQIVALLIYEAWRTKPQHHHLPLLTIVLLADAIIQPYVVLLTFPLFGLLTAYHVFIAKSLRLQRALWLILPALAHGGIVVYQYFAIAGHPIWADFTAQNATLSPPVWYYLMGYLPFLLPIAIGLPKLRDERYLLPILWVLIVIVLLYMPIPTQRRYLLGVQTPLAILAVIGIVPLLQSRLMRLLVIPYVTLAFLPVLLLLFANVTSLALPQSVRPVFYTDDELSVAAWIRENTSDDTLILTTFKTDQRGTGGAVVSLTGRRVFIGHWIETADFDDKQLQLEQFYDAPTADDWREEFLLRVGANYLWYDVEARTYGAWSPDAADYLQPVISTTTVTLYEVRP